MAILKRPSIERPCNPAAFDHCFHATGLKIQGGEEWGKPPFLHAMCCHCAISAVRDADGKMMLHGQFVPQTPEKQVQA